VIDSGEHVEEVIESEPPGFDVYWNGVPAHDDDPVQRPTVRSIVPSSHWSRTRIDAEPRVMHAVSHVGPVDE